MSSSEHTVYIYVHPSMPRYLFKLLFRFSISSLDAWVVYLENRVVSYMFLFHSSPNHRITILYEI